MNAAVKLSRAGSGYTADDQRFRLAPSYRPAARGPYKQVRAGWRLTDDVTRSVRFAATLPDARRIIQHTIADERPARQWRDTAIGVHWMAHRRGPVVEVFAVLPRGVEKVSQTLDGLPLVRIGLVGTGDPAVNVGRLLRHLGFRDDLPRIP
jgi:hypothetical protein